MAIFINLTIKNSLNNFRVIKSRLRKLNTVSEINRRECVTSGNAERNLLQIAYLKLARGAGGRDNIAFHLEDEATKTKGRIYM